MTTKTDETTGRRRGARVAWLPDTRIRCGGQVMIWVVVALVLVVAGIALAVTLRSDEDAAGGDDRMATFTVRQGPLTISVSESGTITASEQEIIKSEIKGQTRIIQLIEEGTRVKKGDLLVKLDASELETEKVDQLIRVQNADASFIRAKENAAVVKNQADADNAQAELNLRFAREDLKKYLEGEYPADLKAEENRITLAKEELQRATDKFNWSQKLYEEKYVSQTELEADRLAMKRAQLDYELAQTSLELLKDYTYKRRVAQLESDVDQATRALDRVSRKAKADIVQADVDLKAKESEYRRQQEKLATTEEQLTKTSIYAPINGMVVYATSVTMNWRGNTEPLDEGQTVRERQELIHLPTTDAMIAETKIHESSRDRIHIGLPVRITVEALPGKVFRGSVTKIAPLPDPNSRWMNPDLKVYTTQVSIEDGATDLRTGMSCQVQIIIDYYPNAIYIPLQAVMKVDGGHRVMVLNGDTPEPRPVKIGLDNNTMVRITEGLSVGERVLLAPSLALTTAEQADAATTADVGVEIDEEDIRRTEAAKAAPAPEPEPAPAAQDQPGNPQQQWQSMTDEQRAEMRKKIEAMSEEERRAYFEKMRASGGGTGGGRRNGGEGGRRGAEGGAPRGGGEGG